MNRRNLLIALGGAVVFIVIIFTLVAQQAKPNLPKQSTVNYTNPVTHQAAGDIIQQNEVLAPGTITLGTATIDDIDGLYTYFTADQAAGAQATINNFLMARSGLADVHAGVKDNLFTQTGSTVSFAIVVDRPQITYQVVVSAVSDYQLTPNVSITEVN